MNDLLGSGAWGAGKVTQRRCIRLPLFTVLFFTCSTGPVCAAELFTIQVVDSQTGRGVPLVEVLPPGGPLLVTDSNGIIAVEDPALLDESLFFDFRSYGYGAGGQTIHTIPGGNVEVAIERHNRAERLYRVTGTGIYRDSVIAGHPVPIDEPLLNANVAGQDSVQTAVYQDTIYWFWGDTIYESGGFNFRAAGATSELPDKGGLDPALGVNLHYFVNNFGNAKQMMPLQQSGLVWLDGVFTVEDNSGQERLLTRYSRMQDLGTTLEQGLGLFNDTSETFRRFQSYELDAPIVPHGHAFRHSTGGEEYVYFALSYPNVRVKADWDHVTDSTKWEAFTPLRENSRWSETNPPLDVGAAGNVNFGWKKNADPLSREMLNSLVQQGHLDRDQSPFRLKDYETGQPVDLHRASVHWNEYRKSWIMIGTEIFGDSLLGEIWFAEAPAPEGPWESAVKVVSHDRGDLHYSFYNPALHPYFDQEGGRYVYFEGTYTNTFSGNPDPTPLYDYNQIMYRLDLATVPPLALPQEGDFNGDGGVDAADYTVWRDGLGTAYAADDYATWRTNFGLGVTAETVSAVPVPESTTWPLAAVAVVAGLLFARVGAVRELRAAEAATSNTGGPS